MIIKQAPNTVYRSMARIMVVLCLFLTLQPLTAMVTHVNSFCLPNKRVTVLADRHGARESGAHQLEQFMVSLAKLSGPLHILIEQAPDLYYQYARTLGVLTGIATRIRESSLPAITTENIEIRPKAWAAYYILSRKDPSTIDPDSKVNHQDDYFLKDITFQQVMLELHENHTMLQKLFGAVQNMSVKTNFTKAGNALSFLNTYLTERQIALDSTVLAYKKSLENNGIFNSLATAILNASSPLLELNIMHKIITNSHRALAIIAGYHHTSKVVSMLLDAHAQLVYQAGSPLSETPITAEQFTSALIKQPRPTIIKYGPILSLIPCVLALAIWYYYWIQPAPTT